MLPALPSDAILLTKLLRGESSTVTFVRPLVATGIAALRDREDIEGRVSFSDQCRSYAQTIGLIEVLRGKPPPGTPLQGRSYSPLARLNNASTVERCTETIMDFIYPALASHHALATQVGRVIGELHDNVASHARGVGFSAAQLYKGTELRFAVVDAGRGMLANVRTKLPSISSDTEAIRWCLEKGHTTAGAEEDWAQLLPDDAMGSPYPDSVATVRERNPNHHVGEGLWQLRELVSATGGSLFLWSGDTQLLLSSDGMREVRAVPWQGVAVEVTLPVAGTGAETAKWGSTEQLDALARRLGI